MIRTDLHMHTRESDGTYTIEEMIKEIKKEGIEFFSITNHDTIKRIEEAEKLAKENNLNFMRGVEISTLYKDEMFHILGYKYDFKNDGFLSFLDNNVELLKKKDDDSIKTLIEHGYDINFEEYISYKHDPSRGGWKTLNFLIDKGFCKDVDEFFKKVFINERKLVYPQFPHPKKAIEEIHKAAGLAVLAHPKYGKSKFSLQETLNMFKEWGIDGIECSHPHHSEEIIKECKEYCKNNKLIITGGSDFHGGLLSKRKLGKPEFYMDKEVFNKFLK